MGVLITQYRHAIGCFNPISTTRNRIYTSTIIDNYIKGNNSCSPFDNIFIVLYFIFIFYALVFLEVSCVCLTDTNMIIIQDLNILYYHMYGIPSYSFLLNNNFLYLILICRTSKNQNSIRKFKLFLQKGLISIKCFLEVSLAIYITCLNITLIIISNCLLLNPGPNGTDSIKVFYQIIHGLLTFSSLGQENPTLNITKLIELQAYIKNFHPDILVLNETWLKSPILDTEIFPDKNYTVYRLDRNSNTHPPCPNNTKKFRKNGGGVLIAVSNNLDMTPKLVKIDTRAEILSITLKLKGNKKICITTCYRVGTLGDTNYEEITKHIEQISGNKNIKHHIVVGDFNLDTVNWDKEESSSNCNMHRKFINLFNNHCLTQLIKKPTRYLGNTLDLLLTNSPNMISDIHICDHNQHVKSDHFVINFNLNLKECIKRKKARKNTRYKQIGTH